MGIEITSRHADITDAVRDHVSARMEKLQAEFPNIENIHVILSMERFLNVAEIVIQARRHLRLEVRESLSDMYAAIDAAANDMEKRLRKAMDKRHDHKSRLPLSEVAPAEPEAPA